LNLNHIYRVCIIVEWIRPQSSNRHRISNGRAFSKNSRDSSRAGDSTLEAMPRRWVVLTSNFIFTFKERREYHNPTEIISLKEIISIKAAE
jgi:hypothetical protein